MITNKHIQLLYYSVMLNLHKNGCCLLDYSKIGDKYYYDKLKEIQYIISLLKVIKNFNVESTYNCLTEEKIILISNKILFLMGVNKNIFQFYDCWQNQLEIKKISMSRDIRI